MLPPPLALLAAWILDAYLGEPRRLHPLAGLAAVAGGLERTLNRPGASARRRRLAGALATALLVAPATAATALLAALPGGWLIELAVLYLCLGGSSLRVHARAVAEPLRRGDTAAARAAVAGIVSRDSSRLTETEIARAATESTLENGNDAVLATVLWFLVAGAPGAVAHRLINTLDALWGYSDERFRAFGWAAARLDDLLGWLPARLTAVAYALAGLRVRPVYRAVREDAAQWPGLNPGVVMAAGAAALGTRLGGPAAYGAGRRHRPWLGDGTEPDAATIDRAVTLVDRAAAIALAAALALWLLAWGGP